MTNSKRWATYPLLLVAASIGLSACADMTRSDRNTAIGAGAGAVLGSVITGGSTAGAVGGAVIGGVIGNEVDKKDKDRR